MIEAKIDKNKPGQVWAVGDIPELMRDIATLVSGIYNQFNAADPAVGALFRTGLTNLVNDKDGACWKPVDGASGIIFHKQD